MRHHTKRLHVKDKSEKCDQCDYSAVTTAEITIHSKRKHYKDNIEMKNCKDTNCEYKAITEGEVKQHYERTHLKLRNYFCKLCTYAGYQKSDMKDHMSTHNKKIFVPRRRKY